jgi:hypothetical protein
MSFSPNENLYRAETLGEMVCGGRSETGFCFRAEFVQDPRLRPKHFNDAHLSKPFS